MREIKPMPSTGRRLNLILDLGGVIVDHDNALCYDRLIALLENRPTHVELVSVIAASGVGNGSVTAEGLFSALRERYGSAASEQQFLDAWSCHFTLKEDVYRLLKEIKEARRIVICSNTNAAHWNFLNDRYGLDQLAAKAILSHECRCEKPKPEIYLIAAAAHGAEPHECLFVDDLAANIEGAKALGFETHQFTGYKAFRRLIVGWAGQHL
jgi:HAD superfamily hydrolase (TIGR01509 family)